MLITITNSGLQNGRPTSIGSNTISVPNRTSYLFTLADFTTGTNPAYSDPEGDAMSYIKILSLPPAGTLKINGVDVSVNDLISSGEISTSNFYYDAPNQDSPVNSTFQFDAADVGSNSLSGLDTGFIELSALGYANQPPDAVGNNTISLDYGVIRVFTRADFTTSTTPQYNDPEGDAADKLKVLDLPANGTLQFNGVDMIANQIITFAQIDAGYFSYVPNLLITDNQSLEFNFAIADLGSGEFTTTS